MNRPGKEQSDVSSLGSLLEHYTGLLGKQETNYVMDQLRSSKLY